MITIKAMASVCIMGGGGGGGGGRQKPMMSTTKIKRCLPHKLFIVLSHALLGGTPFHRYMVSLSCACVSIDRNVVMRNKPSTSTRNCQLTLINTWL